MLLDGKYLICLGTYLNLIVDHKTNLIIIIIIIITRGDNWRTFWWKIFKRNGSTKTAVTVFMAGKFCTESHVQFTLQNVSGLLAASS